MALPTNESLQKTQRNMDSIDEFVSSSDPSLNDQYGSVRKTLTGVEEDANAQLANQEQTFQNRFAPSVTILPWEPLTLIESALQRYSTGTIGESGYKEWLADPAKVPFTTSATFTEDEALDRWIVLSGLTSETSFTEQKVLVDGQTTVVFSAADVTLAKFFLCGDNVDNGILCDSDYTITNSTTLELNSSYPADTIIIAQQGDLAPDVFDVVDQYAKPFGKPLTLEQARTSDIAKEGDTVTISDRGNGLFKYKTGQVANGYDIVACEGVATLSIVLLPNKYVHLDQIGCKGDGVITNGVASGTDDVLAINRALELGLPIIGDNSKLYYITATRVRRNGSNELRDIHILAADNLDLGLELGWRSTDFSGSTSLVGADLVTGNRVIEVADATGIEAGQLITLKSTKVWPYDTPRDIKCGETNVVDSISGNFITLVSPLSNTFQLGTETVSVLTYPKIQQRLNNVSVEYGSPIEKGGMSIQFGQNDILTDVRCQNATAAGLNMSSSWQAAITRPTFIDCWLTGGATGYGMQENNCAYSVITGLRARGCRRGYDASGTYPTRYSIVDSFTVSGELTGTSGSGVGTHSGCQGITFSNGKVDGCDIGVQIRGPNCTVDNVDCLLNTTPITLSYTLACTIQNCKEDVKYTSVSTGSISGFPARFIDVGNLPDDLSNREKLIVQNNRATTRLDFIKINGSLNDGVKYVTVKNNYSNLLTNSSANTINFFNSSSVAALSECVVLGNTFETNGHVGGKNFYNPNLTISDAAPNALQNVQLDTQHLAKLSGTATLAVNAMDVRWESDGEYCHVFGEVDFTLSGSGTADMILNGMQQKKDLNDLGVQMGGLFNGAWSDILVTKNNRSGIYFAFEGYKVSRDTLEAFPLGNHAVPIDIKYAVRYPMN